MSWLELPPVNKTNTILHAKEEMKTWQQPQPGVFLGLHFLQRFFHQEEQQQLSALIEAVSCLNPHSFTNKIKF